MSVVDSIKRGEVLLALDAVGQMSCCFNTGCVRGLAREAVVIVIVVGAVIIIIIIIIIVGFIFTNFSGRGVRGGLNEAVAVGSCGGEGCNGG